MLKLMHVSSNRTPLIRSQKIRNHLINLKAEKVKSAPMRNGEAKRGFLDQIGFLMQVTSQLTPQTPGSNHLLGTGQNLPGT